VPAISAPAISAEHHLEWAARAARKVARRYGLRGAELDDLVSVAHLTLCELCRREDGFDPARVPATGNVRDAFRGWAYPWVKCACEREALRIRGGGLFVTARPENVKVAGALGDAAEAVVDEEPEPEPRPDGVAGTHMVDAKPGNYGRTFRGTGRKV
jgi:hypothetical protein